MRRVVITGFDMLTPLGLSASDSFANMLAGKSGTRRITAFDARGLKAQVAAQVADDFLDRLAPLPDTREVVSSAPRGAQLGMLAMLAAAKHAHLHQQPSERMGVCMGTSGTNYDIDYLTRMERFLDVSGRWDQRRFEAAPDPTVTSFHQHDIGQKELPAMLVAHLCGAAGPCYTVSSTCASGSQAIGEAYWMVQENDADIMLAGGCDSFLNFPGFASFDLLSAMSSKYNDTPEKASRPFDRKRNGFVMGEAGGAVVLEELEHALRRQVPIYAEVIGYASSCDGYRVTDSAPDGIGARIAMQHALESTGLDTPVIDYINAHGTATLYNDRTETLAVKHVFGERAYRIPMSSIKSMTGHSIGGAGAIELVTCVLTILHNAIPPTINYEHPDPDCDLDYVPNTARYQPVQTAMSNSFGFGGQNASLIVRRYEQEC